MNAPSASSSPLQPEVPRKPPSGELPPVEPPTMGFILQLFVIPMVIVTIIVMIWLLFNWLAHMGSNPKELVSDLKRLNVSSWQKALTLADLLRNPQHEELKRDVELATELGNVLDSQIQQAAMSEDPIRLRTFLCRALGEFQIPAALPPLLKAAQTERDPAEVEVRLGALQALAVYVSHNQPESLRENVALREVLENAARERASGDDPKNSRAELRSHAAYTLGVLGGKVSLDQLATLLDDAYPNARYNAAIGFCRAGDPRGLGVLAEMLDPNNVEAVRHETSEQTKPWKRLAVMQNGLRAAKQLADKGPPDQLAPLLTAIEKVQKSDLAQFEPNVRRGIHIAAEEVEIAMKGR